MTDAAWLFGPIAASCKMLQALLGASFVGTLQLTSCPLPSCLIVHSTILDSVATALQGSITVFAVQKNVQRGLVFDRPTRMHTAARSYYLQKLVS